MLLLQLQLLLLSHALGNAATATKATTAGSCTGNANTATTANSAKTCTGNSATASKLATARNIKIQGAVSGNANFDGSANITIKTTQANIVVVTGSMTFSASTNTATKDVAYPTGFNKDNCVPIAFGYTHPSNKNSYKFGGMINTGMLLGFNATKGKMEIAIYDSDEVSSNTTIYYKIVLMKI